MRVISVSRLLILLLLVVVAPSFKSADFTSGFRISTAYAQTVAPSCPQGYTLSGNTCVRGAPKPVCPQGYTLSGNNCVKGPPAPSCPSGFVFSGGQCVAGASSGPWAFVVRTALGVNNAGELEGATICVITGDASEAAVGKHLQGKKVSFQPVAFDSDTASRNGYLNNKCDVYVAPGKQAISLASSFKPAGGHKVLPEQFGAPTGTAAVPVRPAPPPIRTAPPVRPAPTVNLALELQKELKRIGCYTGGLDGDWGRGSQSALQRFSSQAGLRFGSAPSQQALDEARRTAVGYCQPVRVAPKRPKPKGCRAGTVLLDGQCIPKSQVQSFCGPGFERRGSKCVSIAGQQQQSAPKPKNRCSAIKFAFTRGNTCACSGGRIFTGSHCELPEDLEIVPANPQPSGQCRAGATKKVGECYHKCVCEMLGCSWKVDACH